MALASLPACSSSAEGTGGAGGNGAGSGGDGSGANGAGGKGSGASSASGGHGGSGGGGATGGGGGGGAPATRDPLQQPFSSKSIWNMPLGSGARYVDANLPAKPGRQDYVWAAPFSDSDDIILEPDAPLVDVRYSSAAWNNVDRCAPRLRRSWRGCRSRRLLDPERHRQQLRRRARPDGRTFVQFQPMARCAAGGVATSFVRAPDADLYGDGILGAHGGSGLSTIGGTLRLEELRPGDQGAHHALKMTANMKDFYKCLVHEACFRWPAVAADGYAVGHYGTSAINPNVNNKAMTMGVLLALPPDLDLDGIGLVTEPAKQIAWTLQNYGAYVDDDAYGPSFYFGTEVSPKGSFQDQFKADYGFDFNTATDGGDWADDIQKIMPLLQAVDNNDADHVGGGGTPRQPLAPEIAPP